MAPDGQATAGSAPVKVPADLLDADMLYQRDAVLHSGGVCETPLDAGRRRVLHALVSAREGEVVADPGPSGADVLAAEAATLVVDRAVADVDPPRIVVVAPGGRAAMGDWLRPSARVEDAQVAQPWLADEPCELPEAKAGLLGRAAAYLERDASLLDLRGARMGLRGRLDRINSARMILVNVVAAGGDERAVSLQVDRLAELCRFGEGQEVRLLVAASSLKRVDQALDPIRVYEAWLALHVYECVWLDRAERGEGHGPLELVRYVSPEGLGDAQGLGDASGDDSSDDRPLDLLGVLGAHAVGVEEVRPLASSAQRVFVAGDRAAAGVGSALAAADRACRWDFSAGADE